jgi:IgGFc binding protein
MRVTTMRRPSTFLLLALAALVLAPAAAISACGGDTNQNSSFGGGGSGTTLHSTGPHHQGSGGAGGVNLTVGSMTTTGVGGDPKTCAQAAMYHTYIGCDFWPTVLANNVWSVFDYAVVVANTGDAPADVTVTGNGVTQNATVMPDSLATVYLPWVPELKGPDANCIGSATPLSQSVFKAGGAYHLTSTVPVTVYQFSALEYAGMGGPPGKDWSSCPGPPCGVNCFSYTNDASLLLPSTAMTPNYRVVAHQGWTAANMGPNLSITATEDGTMVEVKLTASAHVIGGTGVTDTPGGSTLMLSMNAGDVAELVSDATGDFSGSLVTANNKAVQVITGMPCVYIPDGDGYCDHIEESNFPAETLGQHYFVTKPSGPNAVAVPYWAKIYGNVDGTQLTYPSGGQPASAPTTINAGQVVDLGQVMEDFEIKGDHEFAVATWLLAATIVDPTDPTTGKGDPAQSQATAVEQYREKYVFLAPTDYEVNFVDVVAPLGDAVTIDTVPVPANLFTAIGSSSFGIAHLQLTSGNAGAHVIEGSKPFGIQVMGYGAYTSYMYPGGLNLGLIAPPPPH